MKINQKYPGGFAALELLVLLALAAVIAGGAYYVGKNHSESASNKTVTSSSKSSASQSTELKPGWHLYTDSSAGYSLQIPGGWSYIKGQVVKDYKGDPEKRTDGTTIYDPDSIRPDGADSQSTEGIMEVGTDTTTSTPKQYFEDNGFGRANYTGQGSSAQINGYEAYTAEMTGQGGPVRVPVIIHKGKVVQFFYYDSSSMNKQAALSAEIISTIKFL